MSNICLICIKYLRHLTIYLVQPVDMPVFIQQFFNLFELDSLFPGYCEILYSIFNVRIENLYLDFNPSPVKVSLPVIQIQKNVRHSLIEHVHFVY